MKKEKNNYKAWDWDYRGLPKNAKVEDAIRFFLNAGVLAASIHNTQPWKFDVKGQFLTVSPDLHYYLPAADPNGRNLVMSLGCFSGNIESIAAYYGYLVTVRILGDTLENLSIEMRFLKQKELISIGTLAPFIVKRFSNKFAYATTKVEKNVIKELGKLQGKYTGLSFEDTDSTISSLSEVQAEIMKSLSKSSGFRKELSNWLRPNDTGLSDGMPGFVVGLSQFQSQIGSNLIAASSSFFSILIKKDKELLNGSPLVGVISTKSETYSSWFDSGCLYELLCLKAAALGLSIAPMHSLIEDMRGTKALQEFFGLKDRIPLMFFRLGYAKNLPYHTPRRSLFSIQVDSEKELARSVDPKMEIKQIKINNYIINYVTSGKGAPLLLIHGGNIGWGQWYPNIAQFAKHFTVYAIDLPGAGRSSLVDYYTLDPEKDLVDVVEKFTALMKLKPLSIVGSSIGGWIALRLAIRKTISIKNLVVVDAIGFSGYANFSDRLIRIHPFAVFLTKTVLNARKTNKNIESFLRSVLFNKKLTILKEFIDYFYETMARSHNLLFISRLSVLLKRLVLTNDLPKITCRTLIVWGEKDKLMPIDKNMHSFSLIPGVKVITIKNAGHIPSIEKSDEFNRYINSFLMS